jgi:hypothetical protein
MKKIFFTLLFFSVLVTEGYAAAFYHCVDSQGNSIITDNPPPDVKCKSTEGDDESLAEKPDSANKQQQRDVEVPQEGQNDETTRQQENIKKLKKMPLGTYR